MKNTLLDLNNHLFAQLEKLNDDDLKGEQLNEEIQRSREMTKIATQIINNSRLSLEATKLAYERLNKNQPLPEHLNAGDMKELAGIR